MLTSFLCLLSFLFVRQSDTQECYRRLVSSLRRNAQRSVARSVPLRGHRGRNSTSEQRSDSVCVTLFPTPARPVQRIEAVAVSLVSNAVVQEQRCNLSTTLDWNRARRRQ